LVEQEEYWHTERSWFKMRLEKSLRFQSNAELIDQRQVPPTLSGIAFVCCVMVSVAAATKVSLAVFRVSMFLFVGVVLAAQSITSCLLSSA